MSILAAICLVTGALVILIGSIGLLRLPDFFCRLHGSGTIDTLGAWLVLVGLLLVSTSIVVAFKVIMIAVLLYFLAPTVSHAIANAAIKHSRKEQGND